MQDEWTHEHQTTWEIYCHLDMYMEAAQQVCPRDTSSATQTACEWLALLLYFSSNFFFLSSGKLFLNELNSAI